MKNSLKLSIAGVLLAAFIAFNACQENASKPTPDLVLAATNGLPQDAMNSCTVSAATFDSWFVSGKASENGIVRAANSVTFPHENNCSFYQWSQQMFLWLTSRLSDGQTVLESPLFYSVSPENAQQQRTLLPHTPGTLLRVNAGLAKLGPNRKMLKINAQGIAEEIDSEEGQATGDALISQTGSLVYYITMVNDVYAFYLNGAKAGKLNGSQFPTTAGARDSICAYARQQGVTLPDSNTLAMEIKSSWVLADKLPNAGNYVTINAVIPTYDTSNPNKWVATGETTAKLALVGIHIVGSVAGHPEMVWATFEHNKNTPNAPYVYLTNKNTVTTVPQDGGTGWLFSANPADPNPNVSHIKAAGSTLTAASGQTISASNTLRVNAWGAMTGVLPNQQDTSTSASNSEIISINNTINRLLVGNDLRKNYNLIGATWTFGGNAPNGSVYSASNKSLNAAIGTSQVANSTMETYLQSTPSAQFTCFSCHNSNTSLSPGALSHVYDAIQPLSPAGVKIK